MVKIVRAWKRKIQHLRDLPRLHRLPPEDRELIACIRTQRLTCLSVKKLIHLADTCRFIEDKQIPGMFLEAGCALGGSSILIASLKASERVLSIHDVFEMIPPPTHEDTPDAHDRYQTIVSGNSTGIGGDTYYGYQDNLCATVRANLDSFGIDLGSQNISLIKGLVQDTLLVDQPVALAHVDVDWYEPVMTCLQRITPHLSVGGSIILDDYRSWGGCKKATDEFLQGKADLFQCDNTVGPMKLTRITT